MEKMKVIPVNVPWMISPSFDFASFVGDDDGNVRVSVICNYNTRVYNALISKLKGKYGENIPDEELNKAGSAMIEISFTPRCFFSVYGKIEGYEKYDFSTIETRCKEEAIKEMWNKSGICPTPGFYEVVESHVKEDFGFNFPKVKHWLLCGHDSYIEVLAYSFEWKEVCW